MLSPINSLPSCLPLPLKKRTFSSHTFVYVTTEQERQSCAVVFMQGFSPTEGSISWRGETCHWNQLVRMKPSTLAAFSGTWSHIIVTECEAGLKNARHTWVVMYLVYMCGSCGRADTFKTWVMWVTVWWQRFDAFMGSRQSCAFIS